MQRFIEHTLIIPLLLILVMVSVFLLSGCGDSSAGVSGGTQVQMAERVNAETSPAQTQTPEGQPAITPPAATDAQSLVANAKPAAAASERSQYIVNVKVETVTPAPLRDVLVLPGETEALSDVSLASERAGVVEWVGVTEGQTVRAGQQIIRINLNALEAVRDRAKANLTLAEDQLRRRRDLYERKVLSREELEQAETERTVAQATLREAEVNYSHGITTSTTNGVVNKVYVDPGEYIAEGATVADIVNVDTLRVNFNVPEADVRFLSEGSKAVVRLDTYPGREWEGTVDFVAWKADTATRTFRVRLVVNNRDGAIRPGMIARGAFVRRSVADALTAPLFSVLDKGGERVVFVERNGVAEARTVELGVIDGDRVEVRKGLDAGDRLIVVGHTEVEDGTKVNVR
ncbi:efflux RND transporter periplasmic adaptor subunit [Desulfovibrio psychrotolerans]|uniref:MexH family multidrug efflux RND transporter periplasmic adaptor subunit n=1 Tax=Desulfovibrio psychrotolerans TaxID=415242 RepID=A0A7J0BQE5_9BACT|nr:efflux RND transporter periplasmic adaptor subunit [Desulfovibrio psychrotolerans]GFM35936.1 MexH family multidrug efflux RND transporter periplasmic adaptor subunit [Desulfovibrio psychrotolerans]